MTPRSRLFGTALACAAALFCCKQAASIAEAPAARAPLDRNTAHSSPPSSDSEPGLVRVVRQTGAAAQGAELPLVVVLHGLGDNAAHFVTLFDGLAAPARLVALEGPDTWGPGHSWFPIRRLDEVSPKLARDIMSAAQKVAAEIEALKRHYPTAGEPVVVGFSQGAVLSLALATRIPEGICAVLPIAGWLPRSLWPSEATAVPIWALHGALDEVLALAPTERAMAYLRTRGQQVDFRVLQRLGHSAGGAMRAAATQTLEQLIGRCGSEP